MHCQLPMVVKYSVTSANRSLVVTEVWQVARHTLYSIGGEICGS